MRATVKPDVAQRVQAANSVLRSRLQDWGPLRVLHGSALALLAIGTILPLMTVTPFGVFMSATSNAHIWDFGPAGWLLLLLGIVLGAGPFVLSLTRRANMAAFGAAACGLGALLVGVAGAKALSSFAQVDFGYYALTVSFGLLVVAYWRRFWNATTLASNDIDADPTIDTIDGV